MKTILIATGASLLASATLASLAHAGVDIKSIPITKDAPPPSLELLTKELGDVTSLLKASEEAMKKQYSDLVNHFGGVKADSEETKQAVAKHAADYAEMVTKMQMLTQAVDQVKKELDSPIHRGGDDLKDNDTRAAIELQRRAFLFKGGNEFEFKADMTNLVPAADYRSAAQKLMRVGLENKETIIKSFTTAERKAFDMASMDMAFFNPQMLGIEIDCEVECASLLDLYMPVTVGKSTYMFPHVTSYGDIGSYQCDAKCDAELGPEGNIKWDVGKTHDFRGMFCFHRKVLAEANYDLLDFMMRSAARSHRINRNRALITGDGINEPRGWLSGNVFQKYATGAQSFNHVDFRRFMSSAPVEYGPVVATMHQNVFGYLAAQVDNSGRFIFGDGLMTYSPDDTRERIRISNCLPDPTEGGTKGSAANPFDANDFLVAAGNWRMAFASVSKRPMFMEQFVGGSSAWCVAYQFGAEDGGFPACSAAARTLYTGA